MKTTLLASVLMLALCSTTSARCEHDSPEMLTDECKADRENEILGLYDRMHTPASQADVDKLRDEIAKLKKTGTPQAGGGGSPGSGQ